MSEPHRPYEGELSYDGRAVLAERERIIEQRDTYKAKLSEVEFDLRQLRGENERLTEERDHLEVLRRIVLDLALCIIGVMDRDGVVHCHLCARPVGADTAYHEDSCPWRRARVWREEHQRGESENPGGGRG